TISQHDAFFRIQQDYPTLDPNDVLERIRQLDKIEVNSVNGSMSYKRDLEITNLTQLRTYIRTHSQPLSPVSLRLLREATQPSSFSLNPLTEMETRGEILIMRSLGAQEFRDAPLPRLGRPNVYGLKITDGRPDRWRCVWWDELKERGKTGKRVVDEVIWAWDEVEIGEKDDVGKLLEDAEVGRVGREDMVVKDKKDEERRDGKKKKKKNGRALKITNTHMIEHGIDFTKDYQES
ncbi:hypothetical protein TREMEDRAFT_35345, partial [Tremella mesenterica DSM 1558]|uniref:uncharacterized protein n=1 Tax=Tremella mesenterica (strain ATCC 24925 / CBS 8224 / DSM 1558 / NBRC 9311 / NRRL Y-6157 / RJB 2259-6 / UBC 559-6) TaxID=578456 RepID=UPI00032BA65C